MGATRNEKGEFLHVGGCSHLVCHLLPPSLCLLVTGFWAVADKIGGSLIVVENTPWYLWKYWYLPDSLSLLHVNNSTVHQTAGCPYLSLSLSLSLCMSVNVGLFSVCVCVWSVCMCVVCGAGWRREVVHRGMSSTSSSASSKPAADVYYFTPNNMKLVSSGSRIWCTIDKQVNVLNYSSHLKSGGGWVDKGRKVTSNDDDNVIVSSYYCIVFAINV